MGALGELPSLKLSFPLFSCRLQKAAIVLFWGYISNNILSIKFNQMITSNQGLVRSKYLKGPFKLAVVALIFLFVLTPVAPIFAQEIDQPILNEPLVEAPQPEIPDSIV